MADTNFTSGTVITSTWLNDVNDLRYDNDGASRVKYTPSGTNAIPVTVQTKLRDSVSVTDFTGADPTGVADSLAAFTSAIASLPTLGGRIRVPAGTWNLSATPTWGTKSIYWDIDVSALFTGAGTGFEKFPSMRTTGFQLAAGPWIVSQSALPSPTDGGIAALNVEMVQPPTYVGNSVGLFAGARGSNSNPAAHCWASNMVVRSDAGAGGIYQGIEIDVGSFSATAITQGIGIAGVGDYNGTVGLQINRVGSTLWNYGIQVSKSVIGMKLFNDCTNPLVIGEANAVANNAVSIRQQVNGADGVFVQRFTDTTPTGSFFRGVDSTNSTTLFNIDAGGAVNSASSIKSSSSAAGVGYATGAGGTVTQITNKSTAVTLNKVCGRITTSNSAIAASAVAGFTVNNSSIAAGDVVILNLISGFATNSSYLITAEQTVAGSFGLIMRNLTTGSLSEALVIQYVVIKATTS